MRDTIYNNKTVGLSFGGDIIQSNLPATKCIFSNKKKHFRLRVLAYMQVCGGGFMLRQDVD